MKSKTKFKQTEIGKIIFSFFLFFLIIPLIVAYKDIDINIDINPQGVISDEYNVVGDIFVYNITLKNKFNDTINDTFWVNIYFPNNQTISNEELKYTLSVNLNETRSIIPYINQSKDNNTYIWPFMVSGDYEIKICSQNKDIRFIKNYEGNINKYSRKISNYYFYNCFSHYFSAMPQWQYNLFIEEKAAAEKVQEANQKLLDLNLQLENATQIIKSATIMMLVVAIITLYITTTEEKDRRGKLFKFIKYVSRISIIILILYLIYLALIFSGFIIVA